jgi:iron complex transport system substrate-binding protein
MPIRTRRTGKPLDGTHRRRGRRRAALFAVPLLVAVAAGCGSDDATSAADGSAATPTASTAASYPLTLDTAFGKVTIPAQPKRVVAVGVEYAAADAAVALGVLPVGIPEASEPASGIVPWLEDDYQGKEVELLSFADGVPFEKVAALQPDLILAGTYWALDDDYPKLAEIAPTITYSSPEYRDETWQAQTRLVGKALGAEAKAEKLITESEAALAKAAADHPEWKDKTFTFSVADVDQIITANDASATDAKLFGALGLRLADGVQSAGSGELSFEQISSLQADVVIVCYRSPEAQAAFEANPVFQSLDAVKAGHYANIPVSLAGWMRVPSVLSVPEILNRLTPLLEPAA